MGLAQYLAHLTGADDQVRFSTSASTVAALGGQATRLQVQRADECLIDEAADRLTTDSAALSRDAIGAMASP